MRTIVILTLYGLIIFSCSYVALTQRRSSDTATARQEVVATRRIPFKFRAEDFGEATVMEEKKEVAEPDNQPSMPFDAPEHKCYGLEEKRPLPALEKGARYFFPAYSVVCIVPTSDETEKDFATAYPNFGNAVEQTKTLLKTRPKEFRQFDDIFDFPYNNAGWAFKTKVSYLDCDKLSGVFFVTQYTQDMTPTPANNEELTANFQGITHDGKYYVAARFSVTHPSLPRGIDFTDGRQVEYALKAKTSEEVGVRVQQYLQVEESKVSRLKDNSFRPSLPTIKKLLASIDP